MSDFSAFHDPQTGLPNRAAISILLSDVLVRDDDVAVAFFGVEQLARLTDVHGAEAGSDILRGVAARIRSSLPLSATLGRLGGDVLVALVPGPNAAFARILVSQAIERVREPLFIGPLRVHPTINAGIARRLPTDSVDRLLRAAGLSLRHAQRRGGGRVQLFDDLPPEASTPPIAREPEDGGPASGDPGTAA
jgi:diguanylate cyclase (GGDEF)-like protein